MREIISREIVPMASQDECRHNQGFFFSPYTDDLDIKGQGYPGVYKCCLNCKYWLSYNPVTFPLGVNYMSTAQVMARVDTEKVAGELKSIPPMSTGGKY